MSRVGVRAVLEEDQARDVREDMQEDHARVEHERLLVLCGIVQPGEASMVALNGSGEILNGLSVGVRL